MGEPARDSGRVHQTPESAGVVPEQGMPAPRPGMAQVQAGQLDQFLKEQQKAALRTKALEGVLAIQTQYNGLAEQVESLSDFCGEQRVSWGTFGRHVDAAFKAGYGRHNITCARQNEDAAEWAQVMSVAMSFSLSVMTDIAKTMSKDALAAGHVSASFNAQLQLSAGGVKDVVKEGVKEAIKGNVNSNKLGPQKPGAESGSPEGLAGPCRDLFLDKMDGAYLGLVRNFRASESGLRDKATSVQGEILAGLEAAETMGSAEAWLTQALAEAKTQIDEGVAAFATLKDQVKSSALGRNPPAFDRKAYALHIEKECWWLWLKKLRRSKAIQKMGPGLAEFKKPAGKFPVGAGAAEARMIELGILGPDGWGWITTQTDLEGIVGRADAHVPKAYFGRGE